MKIKSGLIFGSIVSVIFLTILIGFPYFFDWDDLMPLWMWIYPLIHIGIVLLMELVRKACNRSGISTTQFMLCTYLPSVALSALCVVGIIISFAIEGEVYGWDNLGRAIILWIFGSWLVVSAFIALIALMVRLIFFIVGKVKGRKAVE